MGKFDILTIPCILCPRRLNRDTPSHRWLSVCNFWGRFRTVLWYRGRSQIGPYLVSVFVPVPEYYDWASQCLACESPKYLSCHSDSSVRLCLSVSWLAWELSMVGVEGQVFPVFLIFVLSSFRFFFFVCANMYVNFIECCSVGHCMFIESAVFCLWQVKVTNHERMRRVSSQSCTG